MVIYFVFFVCLNILMIRTEDNIIIKISINKMDEGKCNVTQSVKLLSHSNFTLKVESEYFIVQSRWQRHYFNLDPNDQLETFAHSNISITYEKSIGSKKEEIHNRVKYTYSHFFIQSQQPPINSGSWIFTFDLLKDYNPWSFKELDKQRIQTLKCNTSVKIDKREDFVPNHSGGPGNDKPEGRSGRSLDERLDHDDTKWLIIVLAIIGALLLAQTSYIITAKVRGRKSNKKNDKDPITPKSPKVKRGSKPERNIADRPPLPLPPDEEKNEPGSPVPVLSTMSPRPKRHHDSPPRLEEDSFKSHPIPVMQKESHTNKVLDKRERVTSPSFERRYIDGSLVLNQAYRNEALKISDEELRSPGLSRRHEGQLTPKHSYKNRMLVNSDDELRSHNFARTHEGPLVPKKHYKNTAVQNSLEELRTPDIGRRHEGPLVSKQSYRNKVLDDSDEEIRTPRSARRQIEAKLAQLPPKGLSASKCFKHPMPFPRKTSSPLAPPEKAPIYPSPKPAPPLYPKKVAALFPSQQDTGRPQDSRRFSDDEWQYEQLQPVSKYLNNYTNDEPYL